VLPWLGAYVLLLAVWALIIARRSQPTLWKGSSLVIVDSLFVAATIVYGVANAKSLGSTGLIVLPRSVIIFDVALMLIALSLRKKWLLIGVSHPEAGQILERCFHQTRSAATRRSDDYVVQCGELEMIAGISRNRIAIGNLHLHLPGHTIRFSGAHASKKAKLIRSLFSKQFAASFPTPRIKA
jgi:hypothetical protein